MLCRLTICLCAIALAAPMCTVCAAPTTYFGGPDASNLDLSGSNQARDDFAATLSLYALETMETVAGQTDPVLFASTPFEATTDFNQVFSYALLAVSPTNALLDQGPESEDGPAFDDWIQFDQPITAFGSYFAQAGDGGANTLTLRLENTGLGTSKDIVVGTLGPGAGFYNIFFFGVTDTDPFDRVTIIESLDYDGILLDNAIAGIVVPEPATWVLFSVGALAACWVGRRRRAQAA